MMLLKWFEVLTCARRLVLAFVAMMCCGFLTASEAETLSLSRDRIPSCPAECKLEIIPGIRDAASARETEYPDDAPKPNPPFATCKYFTDLLELHQCGDRLSEGSFCSFGTYFKLISRKVWAQSSDSKFTCRPDKFRVFARSEAFRIEVPAGYALSYPCFSPSKCMTAPRVSSWFTTNFDLVELRDAPDFLKVKKNDGDYLIVGELPDKTGAKYAFSVRSSNGKGFDEVSIILILTDK